VHDPARYVLPDVVCDFTQVRLEDLGAERVRVTGARGLPPTPHYKVSLTYADGYRCLATLMIVGPEARARAEQVGAAILRRTRRLLAEAGWADYRQVSVEVLGAEALYGPHARTQDSREVILKVAVTHAEERALEIFAREIYPAATSMAQGISGFAGGRPTVQPIVRLCSCLVPKLEVTVQVDVDGCELPAPRTRAATAVLARLPQGLRAVQPGASASAGERLWAVPLLRLAHGRSGDKGDTANIGVLARRPEYRGVLAAALTAQAVRAYLGHLIAGEVERYEWPGLNGWNFVLHRALGGGGVASLRYDPQGKSYAQILMDFPVPVPAKWLEPGGLLAGERI